MAKPRKLPGLHRKGDVTLKRGSLELGATEQSPAAGEKGRLRKLPGKKKPPTLTLK